MGSTLMDNGNRLKLGFFAPNCDGGLAITTAPERWRATWPNNLNLARMADEAGLDFILPIGRWRGWGGPSQFHRETLETLTWATGLLGQTSRITVFATVHAPLIHPIVAAKQMATISHIAEGRFALNLVCGWNQSEFDMFGQEQHEHDERYAYGQEWLDVVRLLWSSEDPVDHHGRHFDLPGLIGRPAPYGGTEPLVINAGFSPAGRDFATRNCECLLTSLIDLEQGRADATAIRAHAGRDIGVMGTGYIVCRPTTAEAQEFHRHYVEEHGDWEAAENLMALQGLHAQSFPPEHFRMFRERFVGGHGGYPIVGDPDVVAAELERISDIGLDGLAFGLVDFLAEFPLLRDEVFPRLEAKGLRVPARDAAAA
jgi:alkanesulfonate monooxygenase SsuD/methylene tetrahydromethanopterin reductase-like flavin-dependent oxidoreductase (luciferase family)